MHAASLTLPAQDFIFPIDWAYEDKAIGKVDALGRRHVLLHYPVKRLERLRNRLAGVEEKRDGHGKYRRY